MFQFSLITSSGLPYILRCISCARRTCGYRRMAVLAYVFAFSFTFTIDDDDNDDGRDCISLIDNSSSIIMNSLAMT